MITAPLVAGTVHVKETDEPTVPVTIEAIFAGASAARTDTALLSLPLPCLLVADTLKAYVDPEVRVVKV